MPTSRAFIRNIDGEIGYKQRQFLIGGAAGKRIVGMLSKPGRDAEWQKAFHHISEHFRPMPGKGTHTRFRKKFCNEDTVKEYIRRATSAPSEACISRLKINNGLMGAPCALLIRKFSESIGENDDQVFLFVFIDYQGTLVTAYPGNEETYKRIRSIS